MYHVFRGGQCLFFSRKCRIRLPAPGEWFTIVTKQDFGDEEHFALCNCLLSKFPHCRLRAFGKKGVRPLVLGGLTPFFPNALMPWQMPKCQSAKMPNAKHP